MAGSNDALASFEKDAPEPALRAGAG